MSVYILYSVTLKTQEHSVSNIHPITIGVNTQSLATIDAAAQPEAPAEAQEPKQSQDTRVNEPQAEKLKLRRKKNQKLQMNKQSHTYMML